jgi:hypothetical protein
VAPPADQLFDLVERFSLGRRLMGVLCATSWASLKELRAGVAEIKSPKNKMIACRIDRQSLESQFRVRSQCSISARLGSRT